MRILLNLVLYLVGIIIVNSASASVVSINPTQNLQHYLDLANEGDHFVLEPGIYAGNFTINKPVEISGKLGAVLDGQGMGAP